MRTAGRWWALVAAVTAVGLVAACGGRGSETVAVVSPAPGSVVELPFVVTVEASVPLGAAEDDLHHVHIWFGDDIDTYIAVEGSTAEIVHAPSGEQEMHVSLRHPDHRAAGAEVSVPLVIDVTPGG